MPAAKKTRARQAQLGFEALSIEGGLLSPEWLSRVAQLSAGAQGDADYRIPKGLNLRDEIGRYWRIAQAHWADFATGRTAKSDAKALTERFVSALLRDSFGFASLVDVAPVVVAERSYAIGHAALAGRTPVVVASADVGLDAPVPAFGDGGRRRTAFGLVQEYLNAQESAMWGLASDGLTLRILRDNASLTRPAWIEADLQRLFTEERYPDFAALWLLLHETRFGREGQPVTECALETWRNAGREEGTRAREHLRRGVEDAVLALGQGFLAHPENQTLRLALQDGTLSTKDYFSQLLRLVYRLIFLLTVEERNLLHPDATPEVAKALYVQGYGMRRLRERAVRRSAHDRFSDLWDATKIVFAGLATGESRLGLPALAGIFAKRQCPTLDAAKLENRALLYAMFTLAWLREDGALARVNWRDMGPEELGSVYESLLELVPQITKDGRQFGFATGGETKGNARKTTGSYYTPDSLVQVLLDSALEPVIADTIARNPEKPIEALLGLSIVDPACGSGHFLLAAARRLAAHVARLQANGTPAAAEYRHALRQVIGHCIYGVDLNPMAVELCKVSLWMEAVEPGLALTFLDSHIQHGNALLGTTPELMAKGIPDAAWDPIEGDDKKAASALKTRNKAERTTPNLSFEFSNVAEGATMAILSQVRALDSAPDLVAAEIERKEATWQGLLASAQFRGRRLAADAWCAAFVWRKEPGELASIAPTQEVWERIRHAPDSASPTLLAAVERLTREYGFFHWHLQFPQVFAKGGFDVVLGNPPWERIQVEEQEFFSKHDPDLAEKSGRARKQAIDALPNDNPGLYQAWTFHKRSIEEVDQFIKNSGRYPASGKGKLTTQACFVELVSTLLERAGGTSRAGVVVPLGVATDKASGGLFFGLISKGRLVSLIGFENEDFVFPAVHHSYKFCLLTIAGLDATVSAMAATFFCRSVAEARSRSLIDISAKDVEALNPESKTCPVVRNSSFFGLAQQIYKRWAAIEGMGTLGPWSLRIHRLFNASDDLHLFTAIDPSPERLRRLVRDGVEMWPVFEAKMLHQFDHRFGTYVGQTEAQARQGKLPELSDGAHLDPLNLNQSNHWVNAALAEEKLGKHSNASWIVAVRDVTSAVVVRTAIGCVLPRVASVNTLWHLSFKQDTPARKVACFLAILNSFVFDFLARQKVTGVHLSPYMIAQLPCPPPSMFMEAVPWSGGLWEDWIVPRVVELSCTAWDIAEFASACGFGSVCYRWDSERRNHLRAELDAAVLHLAAATRQQAETLLDTFRVVRDEDEKRFGAFRTKVTILEAYDRLNRAIARSEPYETTLDPPPADPRVAHPESARPAWAKRGAS